MGFNHFCHGFAGCTRVTSELKFECVSDDSPQLVWTSSPRVTKMNKTTRPRSILTASLHILPCFGVSCFGRLPILAEKKRLEWNNLGRFHVALQLLCVSAYYSLASTLSKQTSCYGTWSCTASHRRSPGATTTVEWYPPESHFSCSHSSLIVLIFSKLK